MTKHLLLKRMAPVALAAFLGYGAACATQSAVSNTTAQQPPSQYGQQAPAGGYGGQGAAAPTARGYTECFGARVWQTSGPSVNAGEIPKTLRVPPGWTPVGGGALGGNGLVILCR